MTTNFVELDVEIPDLAEVEVETPDVEISPAGGDVVLLVAAPGPPGPAGPPGTGNPTVGEVPAGVKNGANLVFTTTYAYRAGTTAVSRNGLRETRGVGYTESGASQITFTTAPLATDDLSIDYIV